MTLIFALLSGLLSPVVQSPERINGVALSLYYEDAKQGMRFETMVDEIAANHATHVSIIVQWAQPNTRASEVSPHPTETTKDSVVKSVIRRAKMRGLKVMLFPILWVEKRAIGDWRGTLKPTHPELWWRSYFRFILHYAKIAREERVDILSIGSEFASLEPEVDRWRSLAQAVRQTYDGRLIYSANWDHYESIKFWDAVDLAGVTGYYRLTMSYNPTLKELSTTWRKIRHSLLDWQARIKKPLIFTELGYPSIDGAAKSPWDYTTGLKMDHEEQRLCYQAFYDTWHSEKRLTGVFFWNWWGPGDGQNSWYTLKGKPALDIVKKWFARKQTLTPKHK